MKQTVVACLSFSRLDINNIVLWNMLENNIIRQLHKLNSRMIGFLLGVFDDYQMRGTRDFFAKLITILPIHIEKLDSSALTRVFEVCCKHELGTDRLFNVFIFGELEKRASTLKFEFYIRNLYSLGKKKFDEDQTFWRQFYLPAIFNFEYTEKQAKTLFKTLKYVQDNCVNFDFTKYMLLVEKINDEFKELKKKQLMFLKLFLKLKEI